MDESNVLDSGFLERINTLLANGEVPGLFEGDEYITLCTQIKVCDVIKGVVFTPSFWGKYSREDNLPQMLSIV